MKADITLIVLINCFYIFSIWKYHSLAKFTVKRHLAIERIVWLCGFLLFNFCAYLLATSDGMEALLAMTIVSVLLIGIFLALSIWEMGIERENQMKEQLTQQLSDYQKHHLQEIEREQVYIRKMRHEMKNLLMVVEAMAEKGDCNGIIEFVQERQQLLKSKNYVKTGNVTVDTVLNYKIPKADMYGIQMELELNIPTKMNVEDVVICGILGNAIDNAVEASKKLPQEKRQIALGMKVEKKNLFIEIANRYDGFVQTDRNGKLLTRKGEVSNHGFGLPVIRQLVEKCNGNLNVSWDKEHFFVRIMIYHVI
ncbi:MAG: GHKL domain-containing protein [Lachnospiraceae bacterium]